MIVGAVVLIVSLVVYSFYGTESVMPQQTIQEENPDFEESIDQDILDQAFLLSTIDTNVIIKESDQNDLEKWLDEQGIGFTEKFAIKTDVTLIDSNNRITTESSVFGFDESTTLSITDIDGNLLDFGGTVQVTFDSVTQDVPNSVTSWADVKFFLDDRLLDNKKLWASYQNEQTSSMSVLNDLVLRTSAENDKLEVEIKQLQDILRILPEYSRGQRDGLAQNLGTSDDSVSNLTSLVQSKITGLQLQISIVDKIPVNPSFSEREKINYTFTFEDENLSDGKHTFRVVFDEINAIVDNKNFNWQGENIAYELDFIVDGSKVTKESEDGDGKISVFKSDNRFIYHISADTTKTKRYGGAYALIPELNDIFRVYVNDELIKTIDSSTEPFEFSFARDSQLKITVNGKIVFDEKTPTSQVNHHISLTSDISKRNLEWGTCFSVQGSSLTSNWQVVGVEGKTNVSTSFGYADSYETITGSDVDQPFPC